MTRTNRCPAVFAGLAGGAVLAMPHTAEALTIGGITLPTLDAAAPFAVGAVTGAAVGATVACIAMRRSRTAGEDLFASVDGVRVREVSNEPEVTRAAEAAAAEAAATSAPAVEPEPVAPEAVEPEVAPVTAEIEPEPAVAQPEPEVAAVAEPADDVEDVAEAIEAADEDATEVVEAEPVVEVAAEADAEPEPVAEEEPVAEDEPAPGRHMRAAGDPVSPWVRRPEPTDDSVSEESVEDPEVLVKKNDESVAEPEAAIEPEPTAEAAAEMPEAVVESEEASSDPDVTDELEALAVAFANANRPAVAPAPSRASLVPEVDVEPVAPAAAPVPEPAAATPSPAMPASARPEGGAHATDDYGDIAENYVRRLTFAERMAARARGVADVLSDRLGGDMMEGVPVIQRADGSVGDVGTTWWDAAMGDAVRKDFDYLDGPTAAPARAAQQPARPAATVAPVAAPTAAQAKSAAPAKRQTVAARVANFDMGLYPEQREAASLDDQADMWQSALDALAEQDDGPQFVPEFIDVIGGGDTLDEPDGLEAPTNFIPFRTPAGHPEVVDTESYIDYLIGEELSHNPSNAVRANAHEYLRVIEGGSTERLRDHKRARGNRRPRHMAAAEA